MANNFLAFLQNEVVEDSDGQDFCVPVVQYCPVGG